MMLEAGGVDVNERDRVSAFFPFPFPHFASFQPVQEQHACHFGFWIWIRRPTQTLGRKGGQSTLEG